MIVAAVDIGTNSVKLTVADLDAGALRVRADTTQITRLGKNVDKSGRLDETAIARTLEALGQFAAQARQLGAGRVAAVGTSALRDAANGPQFVDQAEQTLGGTVEIISGDREAHLIHTAARRDPDLAFPPDGILAVMDIGGGSTEFVVGQGAQVTFRDSLQLGAVRLTERALASDPPSLDELQQATEIVDAALASVPVPANREAPVTLVGSGGTIANLASMERGLTTWTPDVLHGMRLNRAQVEVRVAALAALTLAERRNLPGLEPDRADVIVAGALIQARAMHRLAVTEVVVSLRGLRYGLLYELADA